MGWTWLLWLLVPLVSLVLLGGILLLLRGRALARVVGSFDCAWRPLESQDWVGGVAIYGVDRIDWYRIVSLRPTPAERWARAELVVGPERRVLPGDRAGVVEVRCTVGDEEFYLAMEGAAVHGLTSWVESTPPMDIGTT
ncbi:MAG TPA: DUF2550 family protein [Actinomycetaceae bacterium]|nr:DUF2550 family protein [Actinomycetaceae bacterium]